jgi:NAD(P)-dependent dehydrogenase (short-subunit alcohol dehydrogenase family)
MLIPYSASKASVVSITQGLSHGLARHGITVNAVCPGVVDTKMWELIDSQIGEWSHRAPGEVFKAWSRGIPLRRPETPEDVANAVAFLASSDSDYMTGQAINVDGGLHFH